MFISDRYVKQWKKRFFVLFENALVYWPKEADAHARPPIVRSA